MEDRSSNSATTLRWFLQVALGILLIGLLAIHLIVNHWAAPNGLLTYADVIWYYDLPGIAGMEATFLVVVTVHCLLGVHGIILDLNFSRATTRMLTRFLILAGVTEILYGIWLIGMISSMSVS